MQAPLLSALLVALPGLLWTGLPQAAEATDRVTGLVRDGDWQLVQANCTECHSTLLITQNSGNRGVWQSRLAWMRETQGMDELDPELEARILGYLAEYYGPRRSARRAPIPARLMPGNPYPSQ